jgi:hypothetical protein
MGVLRSTRPESHEGAGVVSEEDVSAKGPYREAGGEPPPYVPEPLPEPAKKPEPPLRYFYPPNGYHDHPLARAMVARGMSQDDALAFLFKELTALRDACDALVSRGTVERAETWNPWE